MCGCQKVGPFFSSSFWWELEGRWYLSRGQGTLEDAAGVVAQVEDRDWNAQHKGEQGRRAASAREVVGKRSEGGQEDEDLRKEQQELAGEIRLGKAEPESCDRALQVAAQWGRCFVEMYHKGAGQSGEPTEVSTVNHSLARSMNEPIMNQFNSLYRSRSHLSAVSRLSVYIVRLLCLLRTTLPAAIDTDDAASRYQTVGLLAPTFAHLDNPPCTPCQVPPI